MADFDILLNGAPVKNTVSIPSTASESRVFTVVAKNGAVSAGKAVKIEANCLLYISALSGNIESNGRWSFTVGPGFGLKGNVDLTVSLTNVKKDLSIQFI